MTQAQRRQRRRKRAEGYWARVEAGEKLKDIAAAEGVAYQHISRLIHEFFPVDLRCRTTLLPQANNPPLPLPMERPRWSVPDEELVLFARRVRAEIAEAEGFERPIP